MGVGNPIHSGISNSRVCVHLLHIRDGSQAPAATSGTGFPGALQERGEVFQPYCLEAHPHPQSSQIWKVASVPTSSQRLIASKLGPVPAVCMTVWKNTHGLALAPQGSD